jgi:hypothetical protein
VTTTDKTGLEIEEHGTTLIVRINGGKHALLSPDIATQLGKLVDRPTKIRTSMPSFSLARIPTGS